jgi:tetratricopeptide (TPR) repeat protein
MDENFVGIFISVLAFLLSLVATVISALSARRERQRMIKNEISSILSRLMGILSESIKVQHEIGVSNPAYYQAMMHTLNQEQNFLLKQVIYLMDQVPRLVTAVEYNTVANALAFTGDMFTSDLYFQKSITTSPNNFDRARSIRGYAVFLFASGRVDEGRQYFTKALEMFQGDNDVSHWMRGQTYETWAAQELQHTALPQQAQALLDYAAKEYQAINNLTQREFALNTLAALRNK